MTNIQTWLFQGHLLKQVNKVSLSPKEKQLTIITTDKIQAFK